MKTLALYHLKGGVGKTAAAVNLAFLAAQYGRRVLLWDLDPQGAATWYLGLEPGLEDSAKRLVKGKGELADSVRATNYERLHALPADFANRHLDLYLKKADHPKWRLREMLDELRDTHDLVILDCPPSFSLVTENVFHAADVIAAPMLPSPLSVRAYEQMVRYLAKAHLTGLRLHPFLSLVDYRRRLHRDLAMQLHADIKTLLASEIPYLSAVEGMGRRRAPLPAYAPADPASRRFEALWLEIAGLLR
ncbi:MAG: AAA family ATPase [Ectothiorhodospiraceae bacterium]|jgi:cellulose biosynthesis protein BcsQ|nr:AAA family ATPase [Ectothiorhodospiraceae bacterium]